MKGLVSIANKFLAKVALNAPIIAMTASTAFAEVDEKISSSDTQLKFPSASTLTRKNFNDSLSKDRLVTYGSSKTLAALDDIGPLTDRIPQWAGQPVFVFMPHDLEVVADQYSGDFSSFIKDRSGLETVNISSAACPANSFVRGIEDGELVCTPTRHSGRATRCGGGGYLIHGVCVDPCC